MSKLRKMKNNPNKGTKGNDYIARSLQELGAARSIVATADGEVIAGNHVLEQAEKLGIPTRVVQTDGSELVVVQRTDVESGSDKAMAIAVADNKATELNLEWDEELLSIMAEDVCSWTNIDDMHTAYEPSAEVKEDDFDPDAHYETKVKAGEVWQLGEHRLMCGDSTDAVAKLMNGERADLVFTDPPYGMNLTPNYKSIHKNHQAKAVDYQPIIGDQDVFDARFIFDLFEDTKEMFLWGADYFRHTIPLGGGWFVWDKTCGKHEGRIGNEFELCWSKQQHKKEIIRIQWAGFVGMEEEDGARVHPTQKPVRLAGWFLSKYSKEGDIVADIFGGSGSTMIACEQLGRKCRMMELDPHYCTVIIARWEKLTGKKALLL